MSDIQIITLVILQIKYELLLYTRVSDFFLPMLVQGFIARSKPLQYLVTVWDFQGISFT